MLARLATAAALAMTLACAPAPEAPPLGTFEPSPDQCDAAKAQSLIGQPATSELAARAQRLTGAAAARWLTPGQIVTMEYRADRVNLVLDEENRLVSVRCG